MVLNLAVVPNVILMPSNFIILSDKIEGYNNILTTATKDMTFGVNKDVNYEKPKPKVKPKVKHVEHAKPKSNGVIDINSHINRGDWGGGGSYVGGGSNVVNGIGNDNAKTTRAAAYTQLPQLALLMVSLTAGVVVSRLI